MSRKAKWQWTIGLTCFRLMAVVALLILTAQLADAQAPLWANRDRLLDSYAKFKGMQDRDAVWNWMNPVRRGVFLTITHNLWHHYLRYPDIRYIVNEESECSPAETDCTSGCNARCLVEKECWSGSSCEYVSGYECWQKGLCYSVQMPAEGAYAEKLIDHVDGLYAVLDGGDPYGRGSCGGENNNRIFVSLDEIGISAIRNIYPLFLPGIKSSGDRNQHGDFKGRRDTIHGQPRAQFHYFLWDHEAKPINRREMSAVFDPWAMEVDIDYNWIHDSNPLCTYSGDLGLDDYRDKWGETHKPNPWWPVEYHYTPGGYLGNKIFKYGVVDAWTYTRETAPNRYAAIFGTGFAAAGNQVHFVRDAMNQVLNVAPVYESEVQINVLVPNLVGTVHVYVTDASGRRSNTETITVNPQ
jgi:hypothetical protein